MQNKEILMLVENLSNERRLPLEVVYEILEGALEAATRKQLGLKDALVDIHLNQEEGTYATTVLTPKDPQLIEEYGSLRKIPEEQMDREVVENTPFDRIATQTARQTIFQKMREAEREQKLIQMEANIGKLYRGKVKKVGQESYIIEAMDTTFLLPKSQTLPGDFYRMGDPVSAVLHEVVSSPRSLQCILSRTRNEMVSHLMRQEIPEVAEDIIQIKAVARVPGIRCKVAIKSNDRRIDPIGACIGVQGSRIQAVNQALGGERIDLALWSENIAQFITNLMAPVAVQNIYINEQNKSADVEVSEDSFPQAIGKGGINIQLARRISGWTIDILTSAQMSEKQEGEHHEAIQTLQSTLNVTPEIAEKLFAGKLIGTEDIAFADPEALQTLLDQPLESIEKLQADASQLLLDQELSKLLQTDRDKASLVALEGMTDEIMEIIVQAGIQNAEALAELATDELVELGIVSKTAETLIMDARKPWFE